MTTLLDDAPALNLHEKQKTQYAIPLWLRDEQIRVNLARVPGRIQSDQQKKPDPIAIVCYGPSLTDTWAQLRDFPVIMTCSGAHRFLIDRGIVPTYHIDVDPRAHKATLIGRPHPDVAYLMASTCHPAVFDLLDGFNVKLWHIFDSAEEGLRILPPGEWALTGGPGAGLRAMTVARFLGYTDQHVFGMDGSDGPTGKHAGAHPSQAKKRSPVVVDGRTFYTTPSFLECAKATFHELDAMPDVTATFYGDGLVQQLAKTYVPTPAAVTPNLAITKPELISADLRGLNARLHKDNLWYGVGGGRHAGVVLNLSKALATTSILDYGCGKGYLAKALPFPIWEYDPAIPGKDEAPRAADIVVCTDVLEHVEDGKVQYVLGDLRRCLRRTGYFVIHLGPAGKTYADGRNTHLTQRGQTWWEHKLAKYFDVAKVFRKGPELHVVVGPKRPAGKVLSAPSAAAVARETPALNLATLEVWRDPYAIGLASEVLAPDRYAALCATYPPADLFLASTGDNVKRTLSEFNHAAQYHAWLAAHPAWQAFYDQVKAPAFVEDIFAVLRGAKIAVPISTGGGFSARFEFSLIPADGGGLKPHTDIPEKVVTLVLGMRPTDDGDGWDDAWGGGTAILRPTPGAPPPDDYGAGLEAFDVVHVMPYGSNTCVVFVKTADSWHSVGPLTGPPRAFRRTVTINIEHAAAAATRRQAIQAQRQALIAGAKDA